MKAKIYLFLLFFLLTPKCIFAQIVVHDKAEAKKTLKQAIYDLGKLNCKSSLENSQAVLQFGFLTEDYSFVAKAYNIIGLNFEEFSDLKKAIYYYERGIEAAFKVNDIELLDYLHNNLGNVYFYRLDDPKKGLKYYLKCYEYSLIFGDPIEIAYSEVNIADANLVLGNYATAKKFLDKIYKVRKESKDFEMIVTYHALLAKYYSQLNDKDHAEENYAIVIEKLKKGNASFHKSNELDLYDDIFKFYKKYNDIPKALRFLEMHDSLQDLVYLKERNQEIKFSGQSIDVIEMNNKIQRSESEKKVQEQKAFASNKILKTTLFFSGILLIFLIYMFKTYLDYRKLNKKLFDSNAQLKIANIKSEEASKLKSQFLSNVSHELRTPLYGVIGMADIIESEYVELKKNKYFNALKFSSNYLLSLINDVLNVYKIEDTKFELIYDNIEIRKEITVIRESLDIIAKSNNNKLFINISDEVPQFIKTDITRFSQILINLISNSLKFTKNGEVSIKLQLIEANHHPFIQIEIIDNGIGIPSEYLDKIFEKFVQVDVNLNEQYKGTGLGLSIVKRLVDLFKGEISVSSEIQKGTVFKVILPYIKADKKVILKQFNISEPKSNATHLKILIVEDNKINQMVTKKLLAKSDHICKIAENGAEAIKMTKKHHFDLILMDIHMPVLNGFEASKKIRELGITTPIIALTASDKNEIINEMAINGINDVLVKPFEIRDLQIIIEKHIQN
ncbi:ATP-binding protein [Flavobacterium difficile]|uniref:histidine kinase n=1 Tax=Flavobacterium difficile TaxID=2709659 RepID=A0ABX0I6Q2_9FLAO|nr:ATP-binding protein [Flavobacterium difficile]NHM02858.1 response regulator [Flavobacterium difficile]